MNERDIFIAALQIDDLQRRMAYLDQACAGDQELRQRVEALLGALQQAGSYLEKPAVGPPPTLELPSNEKPGQTIGPYKLLQPVGEGGMGSVWMAEQHEPVRRRVALKLIKPGMDSRQVLVRFEAERQALSMMDHPNIAKVLDAGTTESGRPYFVMELVRGQPITQYCDEHHLTPRERLELFLPVCHAIQHAHQKGIIHRDIKPSNVLVAEYDGRPVAKVIDFGVAKAIHQPLTEKTMFTGMGQIVGTLEYMSPEQARVNQLDIDTRSDVYSLGVLLYEFLTGSPPFDKQRLKNAALDELLRIIREEEPPRPSTKLSSSQTLPSIAANRKTEPARLSTLVRGELDWIVMKALEKDRNRRYETANGFAMDIQRYLSDEAVLACPPSAAYRFRKFARRNKALFGATAAVTATLVVGLAGTTWQAIRASLAEKAALKSAVEATAQRQVAEAAMVSERQAREAESEQRKLAEAAAQAETEQRQKAEAAEKIAADEAAVSKAVNEFLQHDLLGVAGAEAQLDAKLEPDPDLKLATLLDRALVHVDERFADQPQVRAEVQDTLATAFRSLGRYEESSRLWEKLLPYREITLGLEHPDVLTAMNNLAELYRVQARYSEAESLFTKCLEIQRSVLGPDHHDTLTTMNNLALLYGLQARYAEAEPLHTQSLEIQRRVLGPEHLDTLTSMNNLASMYFDQVRYGEAEQLHTQCLEIQRRVLGPEHPYTLGTLNNLASLYARQQKLDQSIPLFEETLELRKRILGVGHPDTTLSMANLGVNYMDAGRIAEALPLLEEAHNASSRIPTLSWVEEKLLDAYVKAGKLTEAISLAKERLENAREALPEDSPELAGALAKTGLTLLQTRAWNDAEAVLRECLQLREQLAPEDWRTFNTQSMLGGALLGQKQYAEAEPLLLTGYEGMKARANTIPPEAMPRLTKALERLVQLYTELENPDQAAAWQQKLDEKLGSVQPPEAASTSNSGNEPSKPTEKNEPK